ncbi:M15 family metallopeptidase [Halomonas qinghailakensis]|uniref:D-alanyl-D-alanine dipeptidase n=1 Tax=Halomonas qinghailakensis TaxID=2937790 RepID=A0AA46TMR7_9GAMM|nr:M15 family metallopeptidase [Halomonas sp. ZZQ-149]UYO73189.1 M15 family metallopeptidase [Halomonas sp. ZZQ-149]
MHTISTNAYGADLAPIPSLSGPEWPHVSHIAIQECGERLLPMSLAPSPIKVFPAYARLGIPGAIPECFVREGVYRALLAAARSLPPGVHLLVLDGWRPWRVQQYLFDTLHEAIHHNHPNASEDELLARTREFVSLPSRDPAAPSPHLTGGAVDVTLCDADGLPLDMGTLFDEAIPASHTDHFEQLGELPPSQQQVRDNRRLLYHAMQQQGFTNLPSEWWHFDLGDQLWAHYGGHRQACYGPAELDTIENRWRRQIS